MMRCPPSSTRTDTLSPYTTLFRSDQLIQARIDIGGELDFGHRAQAIGAHADRDPDDAAFVDRRVEHAGLAMFFLQARRRAEHTAEKADVLAHHHRSDKRRVGKECTSKCNSRWPP